MFKARFFPNSSIIEAAESRMGSYAWKSILKGRDVLQQGARWQVGNGEKIRIWQPHWLPRKHPPLVISSPIDSLQNATMDLLIDPSSRQWNTEAVEGLFVPKEAEMIKNMPLARGATVGILFWPSSSDSNYNCKSGYRFLKEEPDLEFVQQIASQEKQL